METGVVDKCWQTKFVLFVEKNERERFVVCAYSAAVVFCLIVVLLYC